MIIKFFLVITMLSALVIAGSAASVDINTGTAVINEDGEAQIPLDQYANESVGLEVIYLNWGANSNYSVTIREGYSTEDGSPQGNIVYSVPNEDGSLGPLPLIPDYTQPVHWMPTINGIYTIYAEGQRLKVLRSAQNPINVTPELSTIVLTSAGILGLIGLTRMRRKD